MNPREKKYSECIDFPVEIIGRDGVVRHYSFEESVSLYKRRIRLATLRFENPAEINKEVEHCTSRIAQLRRSYFARYGWESFRSVNNIPQQLSIEFSGELSAYLRRQFGCGLHRPPAEMDCISEASGFWMFSINIDGWMGMLYFGLDSAEIHQVAVQFGTEPMQDAEYLIDTHIETDFSVLMTSLSGDLRQVADQETERISSIGLVYQEISDGNLVKALALCIQIVDDEPFNKQAYWAGMILSEQLRVHSQGYMLAELALSNFPEEVEFQKRMIAFQFRLGDFDKAADGWEQIDDQVKRCREDLLNAMVCIHQRKFGRAINLIRGMQATGNRMKTSIRWVLKLLSHRILVNRICWIALLLWITFGFCVHIGFIALIVLTLVAMLYFEQRFRERLQKALNGTGYIQLTLIAQNDVYALNRSLNNVH